MITNKIFFIVFIFLCACGTVKYSFETDKNVFEAPSNREPGYAIDVWLSKRDTDIGRSREIPFTKENFEEEIQIISEVSFLEPRFVMQKTPDQPLIRIYLESIWQPGGCYLGGCIIWPTTNRLSYKMNLKVFDANNISIFESSDEIWGEERRTGLDFSAGFLPLREVQKQGVPLLIKRNLKKFKESDAFAKLRGGQRGLNKRKGR